MQAKAEARYIRTSPQKIRLVVDLIRGQRAGDAINILRTTNKRIAPSVEKVLRSAIANAENRSNDVDVDKLFVTEAYVNEGPRMKRVRPAPMGRAYRISGGCRTSWSKSEIKRSRLLSKTWVKKYIHTGFGWGSPRLGGRGGSPSRTIRSSCGKIWSSKNPCATG